MRRTTVKARAEALDRLADEASRRHVPLSTVLAEAVEEKAADLARRRKPRLGTGRSGGRTPGAAVVATEPIAELPQ